MAAVHAAGPEPMMTTFSGMALPVFSVQFFRVQSAMPCPCRSEGRHAEQP
jgi:hypothetical protein